MTGTRPYAGLDLLESAVVLLDADLRIEYVNSAAETLFGTSRRSVISELFGKAFAEANELPAKMARAILDNRGFWDQEITLRIAGAEEPLRLSCLATPQELGDVRLLLELRQIDHQLRHEREAQQLSLSQANRELIRNLAHEIKNPLGGIRGSAQLLERELDRPELREYTRVIIKEADRLQRLMERLLTPNRLPRMGMVNIHEVTEHVRSLILAEFPTGIALRRDYDTSLPEIFGDREQLIQAVLNVVRNAAQALASVPSGKRELGLRTRVAHQVTIARARHRLALELQVMDNGPGIPDDIRDRIFYPLVSGRDGGSGLGLTLAQSYVEYHHGVIECDSQPGRTVFRILLPLGQGAQ